MRKRFGFLAVFLALLVVIAVFHVMLQLSVFGLGTGEKGISGLAVDDSTSEGGIKSLTSKAILLAEWGLILLGMIFVYTKHKIDMKKEFEDLMRAKEGTHFTSGTELDNVYELLTKVKHFRLLNGAKLFNVSAEIMEDWAKTLEASELAELTYPRIGGPELVLASENQKKQGFFNKENVKKA